MAATLEDIRGWLKRGIEQNASHVIVVCDTFDYDDYPVYVGRGDDVQDVIKKYSNAENMQRIMEIYKLSLPIDEQLAQHRVWNI